MPYIEQLLPHILLGSEKAFQDFCAARLNPTIKWFFVDTLNYIYQLSKVYLIKLTTCYPELVMEIAQTIGECPGILLEKKGQYFINLIKEAASENIGAQTALLYLLHTFPHIRSGLSEKEYNNLLTKARMTLHTPGNDKNALFLAGNLCFWNMGYISMIREEADKNAFEYWTRASELGHFDAANHLGTMYIEGRAGKDLPQATRDMRAEQHYRQAIQMGNAAAMNNLGWMYQQKRITTGSLDQSESDCRATKLYRQAMKLGSTVAMNNLGYLYHEGRAEKYLPDQALCDHKAEEFYQQAATLGNAAAWSDLGLMYQEGRAGRTLLNQAARDFKAEECFLNAVKLGNLTALTDLGFMYQEGRAGKDLPNQIARDEQAMKYYYQATKLGCTRAMYNLGAMCLIGSTRRTDLDEENILQKALFYFELAKTHNSQHSDLQEKILLVILRLKIIMIRKTMVLSGTTSLASALILPFTQIIDVQLKLLQGKCSETREDKYNVQAPENGDHKVQRSIANTSGLFYQRPTTSHFTASVASTSLIKTTDSHIGSELSYR